MNILLCTLGQSWSVIPEIFALLDPGRCPLYEVLPGSGAVAALRRRHSLEPVDEIWVCTTDDGGLDDGLDRLRRWRDLVDKGLALRIWRTAEVSDVASQAAGDQVRELIYRAVLLAGERTRREAGRLYLSLAGGRKTMSADLQRAGMVIGCHALLHVVAPPFGRMSERMQAADPATFASALSQEDGVGLLPMVVGRGRRSELLDIGDGGGGPVDSRRYRLPMPDDAVPRKWSASDDESLAEEIERREREGVRLLGNYLRELTRNEPHDNWRFLYRLPPASIDRLRNTALSPDHRKWLESLPKADLHRHIGGCLDLDGQRRVGRAIWDDLSATEREAALRHVAPLLAQRDWPWDWPEDLKKRGSRSHHVAALLVEADDELLQHNLFGVTEPRRALQENEHGFSAYERPGELTGSAVLTHPAALEAHMRALLEQAIGEGLRYLELRGSPQKYRHGIDEQLAMIETMRRIAAEYRDRIDLRFLVIADRRKLDALASTIDLAVRGREELGEFVVGLDLAGDEKGERPEALERIAEAFEPAFRACLPITIHAGEGTEPEKIWEAAYRLHADRVGHGLTLAGNERLLQRFRDRGICIELCPTSNDEVVGYGGERLYPLAHYWKEGVPLALCTDNPGISRTDAAGELLKAASFWLGMSCWDALAVIRRGFVHAFLPARDRQSLIDRMEQRVYEETAARLDDLAKGRS